ncbi:MAG: hypothetical protein J6Q54_00215 [Oscillospiraceae bacterium]|nr:hypothetical protein [Oscillospiraceae bacterium]
MAEKKKAPKVRLVFQKSSPWLKIAIIALVLVCTITLVALTIGIGISKANTEAMRQEALELEQDNDRLSQEVNEFGTIQSIKRLAEKLLGLVDPDTVFFTPED